MRPGSQTAAAPGGRRGVGGRSEFPGLPPRSTWRRRRSEHTRNVTNAELVDESGASAGRDADPHLVYEFNERLQRLQRGVDDLSSDQWELFRLRHLENRSIEEIAQQLAKSEDAVKSHLYRARKVLLAR